ncbi:MAG: tRNA (adenosine(37)-N6)-threonylcarbamoyltransferase complex ATPase subunit type 1 TsaE [Cyclobacteriaceae bacterium]|nr:tRNA (adenosine(37)-N6)-threonylcarbamoyltransferase complex ATPase subunit type 1 TsaE [Cyclobacteriaceae bacterium]
MTRTFDLGQISEVAADLLREGRDYPVWCFFAQMGAGKTTLIKAVCEQLGVQDTMGSPTFSIINEYLDGRGNPVYHFDFYRLTREQEASDIGTEDYFYSGNFCLVEWPENVLGILPDRYLKIYINLVNENQREIRLSPHGGEN